MSWLQTEVLGVGSAPRTEGNEAQEDVSMRTLVFSTKDSGHQAQWVQRLGFKVWRVRVAQESQEGPF